MAPLESPGSTSLTQAATPAVRSEILRLPVNLGALLSELLGHFLHALFRFLLRGVVAYLAGDFHGAELRAAHGTEVRDLVAFLRQGLVVELEGTLGVQRQVELVFPAELEARLGQRGVADL